jgi:hypothetical protein
MASIFLSYARGDLAKAQRIAQVLETAGHSVWWDRQLHAGSRFTAEIDAALRKANTIVVLWSRQSVESAWVQDEAAVGRDSGRLLPVLLDVIAPPLGFRQYQAIDFSRWSGRGRPPAFAELVKAVGAKGSAKPGPAAAVHPSAAPKVARRWAFLAAIASLLFAAAGLSWWLLPRTGAPTLVVAAADASPAAESHDFARQVAVDLTRYHPASLETLAILEDSQSSRDADYQVAIGLNRSEKISHADLTLKVKGRPGVAWAQGIDGPLERSADLRQQAASALASVLSCAMEADRSAAKLSMPNYQKFLNGCSALKADYSAIPAADLVPMFKEITRSAPDFALGFAYLALSELTNTSRADPSNSANIRTARESIARAKQLDSSLEETVAADAMVEASDDGRWDRVFSILDHGLQAHPSSVLLLNLQSQNLMSVGRMGGASDTARQALGFDALSHQSHVRLISALTYSNRIQPAYDELAKSEAIWPNSFILENARYGLDLRYGDPHRAMDYLNTSGAGRTVALDQRWRKFLQARITKNPSDIDAALQAFRDRYRKDPSDVPGYLQALGTFGRVDEAFAVTTNPPTLNSLRQATDILFRPNMQSVQNDPRFIALAAKLGLVAYWRQSGAWPDFCSDPDLPYDCKKEAARYAP